MRGIPVPRARSAHDRSQPPNRRKTRQGVHRFR
jgi:hypothetical protein